MRYRPTVAQFIAERLKVSGKSQREVAEACGWPKPNFVTMLKKGDSKLPLDKIGPLANALEVEPVYLFWLVMSEYYPETLKAIEWSIRGVMLTGLEKELIEAYRDLTHGLEVDCTLRVGEDEARVSGQGRTLERLVPVTRPTKARLVADGAGVVAELS